MNESQSHSASLANFDNEISRVVVGSVGSVLPGLPQSKNLRYFTVHRLVNSEWTRETMKGFNERNSCSDGENLKECEEQPPATKKSTMKWSGIKDQKLQRTVFVCGLAEITEIFRVDSEGQVVGSNMENGAVG
jgi:hypothetical protein